MNKKLQTVDDLMHQGQQQGVFPGAVLLIAYHGQPIFTEAYGWANIYTRTPVHTGTLFDLASLTKVLATALALMQLMSAGRVSTVTPLAEVLQSVVPSDKAAITIGQLLDHTAGLPDYRPWYLELVEHGPEHRKAQLLERLLREPLLAAPGSRVCYSDLGFMLLQFGIEALCKRPLEQIVTDLYRRLSLRELFFCAKAGLANPYDIAATEFCPWRKRLLWGEVHDENAYALGGTAGHAGLFGTAAAVLRLLEIMYQSRTKDITGGLLTPEVLRLFFKRRPHSGRALGFDCPSAHNSSAGRFFSPFSVGHLGFTGTSFWMDFHRELLVILLTNRVHPSRHNIAIRKFRPRLHDRIILSLNSK